MACVARRKDGALVVAVNAKTNSRTPPAHAEARVLRKAGHGSILWVARIDANEDWAMARPCPDCQILIRAREVKKVYYTISPGEYGIWYPQKAKKP